jgi:hypothetical protein
VEVTTNYVKARQAEPNDDDKEMHTSLIYYRQFLAVPASTPGGIIEEARKHLRSEADDVNVEHIGDGETFTAGNNEGLDFLKETTAELEQCTRERTSLKENVAHLADWYSRGFARQPKLLPSVGALF